MSTRATTQLVVESLSTVTGSTDDAKTSHVHHLGSVRFVRAAQADVGSTPSHLRRHGDSSVCSGFGNYRSFRSVILSVQHIASEPFCSQFSCEGFRFCHVLGSHQNGLPFLVHALDENNNGGLFVRSGVVDTIFFVDTDTRRVRFDRRYCKVIEAAELFARGDSRTGHTAYCRVAPDERLYGDSVKDFTSFGNRQTFLRFHGCL